MGRARLTIALRAALACAAALAGAIAAPSAPARAQVAAGLGLTTDYRVRGVSYTERRPAITASLSDDFANGVYAGATMVVEDPPGGNMRLLGHQEYLGYARRMDDGLTWDVGLDNQRYEGYGPAPVRLKYTEAYAGLSGRNLSARLYYSPNYNGSNHNIAYFETNAVLRPADKWRVTGHAGIFQPLNAWPFVKRRPRYDGRIELIRTLGRAEVSLGWAGATPPVGPPKRSEGGVILGASVYF